MDAVDSSRVTPQCLPVRHRVIHADCDSAKGWLYVLSRKRRERRERKRMRGQSHHPIEGALTLTTAGTNMRHYLITEPFADYVRVGKPPRRTRLICGFRRGGIQHDRVTGSLLQYVQRDVDSDDLTADSVSRRGKLS